jgi:hypothetical protein
MKLLLPSVLLKGIGLLLLLSGFYGCRGRPERKKMPEFTGLSFEGEPLFQSQEPGTKDWPFYTGDTTIMTGGRNSNFLSIAMPYPAYDSLAWGTIKAYEPFAASFLMGWTRLEKDGILIDLRSNAGRETHRADFQMEVRESAMLPISLVFLWDAPSVARAASFIAALHLLPEIDCSFIGGEDGMAYGQIGRQDCFRPAPPVLDPQ